MQQQFGNATTVQIGYVGQENKHLMNIVNLLQEQLTPNGAVASPYLTQFAGFDRPGTVHNIRRHFELPCAASCLTGAPHQRFAGAVELHLVQMHE